MQSLTNNFGVECMHAMSEIIIRNTSYLSEIDGAIGDGDHGINMAKGFTLCQTALSDLQADAPLEKTFALLASVLMGSIGGSMGPLYGSLFFGMAAAIKDRQQITKEDFAQMLSEGLKSIRAISQAQPGDKTMMDVLVPATKSFAGSIQSGKTFADALEKMTADAEAGRDSTRDLQARVGRASRLGQRSVGVLDAGAVSCCMLLTSLAETCQSHLRENT
ncbi:dihydroxyacetone kinase subunit DhaL [Aliamphritea hakodatensis]|uniref:dihydroxyacetone kinase subunit DhaL n=1 Tax=Aliamphritea hakodatensis TaxID=2895352 RepID=UPI0022FD853F|nr:dihydroxyacetone kinase subunit DhaL [Aliamphritea hakodatensis]